MRALRLLTVVLALSLIIGEIWRSWGMRSILAVLDDLVAGVLMIAAAWAVGTETLRTRTAFSATWGIVVGGLFGSFYSKLAAPGRMEAGNWSPTALIWALGAALLISLICLALSILLPGRRAEDA